MAHNARATPNDTPISSRPKTLTDLPRELRDQIYEYATTSSYALPSIVAKMSHEFDRTTTYALHTPLLASVCKAPQQEVLEVYLSRNTFYLNSEVSPSLNSAASLRI